MSNLLVRILFALIAIPVAFFCLWWNDFSRLATIVFMSGAGAWEWARMVSKMFAGSSAESKKNFPSMRVLAPVCSILFTLAWIFESGKFFTDFQIAAVPGLVGLIAVWVIAVYTAVAFAKVDTEKLFPWWVLQLGAPLYLGLWGGLCVKLLGSGHGLEHSYRFIIILTTMWMCDTMAYFVGKFFAGKGPLGKHPLAPTLSPKKTWEGSFGGTLFAVAWFVLWTTDGVYEVFACPLPVAIVLGFVLAIAGQAGDLLMSALKRWSKTKDSSQIFPGHGGVLDRMDSFLVAAPIAAILLTFLQTT